MRPLTLFRKFKNSDRRVEERVSDETYRRMTLFLFGRFPEGKTIVYLRDGTRKTVFVPEGNQYNPLIRDYFSCDERHADYRIRL